MFKRVLISIAVVIAAILTIAAFQPTEYKVSRELFIKASAEVIFPYLNNVKKTNDWMPWLDSDPNVKLSFSGPEEGVGATSSWESTGQMGVGQAIVIESTFNQSVKTKITYTKPMQMEQVSDFVILPSADGAIVQWNVEGKRNYLSKLVGLFFDMDKFVGGEFEKGLNKLKKQIEKQ